VGVAEQEARVQRVVHRLELGDLTAFAMSALICFSSGFGTPAGAITPM